MAWAPVHSKAMVLFFVVVGESLFTAARIVGVFHVDVPRKRESELLYLNILPDVL